MTINNYNQAYRRGIILGLTLAEIMLLLLFILLLSFMSILQREHLKRDLTKKPKLELVSKKNLAIEQAIQIIEKQDPSSMDDLVQGIEALPDNLKLIKKDSLAKDRKETPAEVISRGLDKLKIEKKIKDLSKKSVTDQLEQSLESQKGLESKITNLVGQNKYLSKQIVSTGKGDGYPSCWVDSAGKVEFIFDLRLSHNGITIINNKISHRQADQAKLPISMITYSKYLEPEEFETQTSGIHKWAIDNKCHFFVRIFDDTAADEKVIYKDLLQTAEGSFYKLLM
jgi:cell division protein FtsL